MREIRQSGSEGGEGLMPLFYPYQGLRRIVILVGAGG